MRETIKKNSETSERNASMSKDEKRADAKQKKNYEAPDVESHSPLESVSALSTTYIRGIVE